ncbi:hypothetical protein L5515_001276 [Caenorhabditis briggsae]|uniref:Olfactomedin-like domain-containing protein n=1 Tax=Caenorhabditis briggsae TaxID=6238 RepID=A0AAE9E321_CAEBR|nr:hypothetical protein L5515_001276 [Caenorhabditis briggsae]
MKLLDSLKFGAPWALLVLSIGWICYQNVQIQELQASRHKRELNSNWLPRSDDDSTIFMPIYAQVSKKHIRKVCMEHFHSLKHYRELERKEPTPSPKQSSAVVKELKRKCSAEVSFGQPVLIGERKNSDGCAYLDGGHWHVCELSHGYTMLSFKGNRRLNSSETRAVQFLPYPFDGTDNMVYNNTMYYSENDRLISYNLKSEKSNSIHLRTSLEPLYANSTSRLDVQAEEHGIWVLYRRRDENILSVSRINVHNMQIVSNWTLPSIDTSTMCNAFVRCAILYSVECDGTVTPVYDFYSHTYIQGRKTLWEGLEQPIGNVQYDPNSKSIAIYANAHIYKVAVLQ